MADLSKVELLRRYIEEPTEDSYPDTLLTQLLILSGNSIKNTASEVWLMEASKAKSQMIEAMSSGGDSFTYTSLQNRADYCLKMSERYRQTAVEDKKSSTSGAMRAKKARNPDWMW